MRWKLCGNKNEWQKGTEVQRKEWRNLDMATNKDRKEEWGPQNRATARTRTEAIERKAMTAKRKVHLKAQHGGKKENGWERENKMEIA